MVNEGIDRDDETYRFLLEGLDEVAFMLDAKGNLVYISPAVERISGYRVDELMQKNFSAFVHPDDVPYLRESLVEQLAGHPRPQEFRAWDKDGSLHYIRTSARLASHKGEPVIAGSLVDVTERHQALEALRDSEKKFRTVLQLSHDGVVLFDERGEVFFWNPGAERIFGYSEEEMLGQSIVTVVPLEFHHLHYDMLEEMSSEKEEGSAGRARELTVKNRDGTEIQCELSFVTWKSGDQVLCSVIFHDVSGRRRAEEALRRSEEYYRSLIEHSQDITLVLNQDGTIRYVSPSFQRVFGHPAAEITGRDAFSLVHPEDLPGLVKAFAEGIGDPGKTVMAEYRIHHADGHWVHVEAFGNNLLYDPAVAGIVINSRDITARREAEEALRSRELYFRCLIENALDMFTIIDVDGTILYESPSFIRILGFTPEEMVGKSAFDFVHPDDMSGVLQIFLEGVGSPESIRTGEFRLRRRDGSWINVESIGQNLLDDPVMQGIVINSREITERKKYEEALEENARQLRDFLSVASHELHHPIAIILGYAQTLAEEISGSGDQRYLHMLEALEKAAERLDRLGDNLLDVSRLEQDRYLMRFSGVDPAGLARQSLEDMETRGFPNPFELRVIGEPGRVLADEDELLRVLTILEENAAGYSPPESPIELQVSSKGEDVLFSVLDRGSGVPENQREKIFERFYQVEQVLHHSRPGLGLGLYIARAIVKEHGGEIWYEPRPGGGSVFSFTLPLLQEEV